MSDFLLDLIEFVVDVIGEGLSGSSSSSKKKSGFWYNESYDSKSYNDKRSIYTESYRTKKPKPMYDASPKKDMVNSKNIYDSDLKEKAVNSAYLGAGVKKNVSNSEAKLNSKPNPYNSKQEPVIEKEIPVVEKAPTVKFDQADEHLTKTHPTEHIDEVTQEEHDFDLSLPKAPTIDTSFTKVEAVEPVRYEADDMFRTASKSDAVKLEILLLNYMFQEDDGKISGKEKRQVKSHFSSYRGVLSSSDIDEIKDMGKQDKSLTNIRAFVNARHIDNTTINNAIRVLKEFDTNDSRYRSIINRIESALLETMGF